MYMPRQTKDIHGNPIPPDRDYTNIVEAMELLSAVKNGSLNSSYVFSHHFLRVYFELIETADTIEQTLNSLVDGLTKLKGEDYTILHMDISNQPGDENLKVGRIVLNFSSGAPFFHAAAFINCKKFPSQMPIDRKQLQELPF